MSLNALPKASPFEPDRSRVIREMCREFGKKISKAEIEIAVDEAWEDWYIADTEGRIENRASQYSYVILATRHKLLNHLRRKEYEACISDIIREQERRGSAVWEPTAIDGSDAERDSKGDVLWLLKQLPKDWRRAVELYEVGGFKIPEIAEQMNRTSKAVSRIVEKAEKRMLELGIKYLGYPPPATIAPIGTKIIRKNLEFWRGKLAFRVPDP